MSMVVMLIMEWLAMVVTLLKFGEQRRGENLGTRAGLGEQGEI